MRVDMIRFLKNDRRMFMCMQYPWLRVLDIPEGRGIMPKTHTWNGDHIYCPETGEEHIVGVYTSGKTCPGCGVNIREPLDETAIAAVQNHCHAG